MLDIEFYVIFGDGVPLYCGCTKRGLDVRLKEHLDKKDFTNYTSVTIKKVGSMSFPFTWDLDVVNDNAKEVSDREAGYIKEYGTQDSPYQKAPGGGPVFNEVKAFVKENKDDPFFEGMTGYEIHYWVQKRREVKKYLGDFIAGMKLPSESYLSSFISNCRLPSQQYMSNFISSCRLPSEVYMSNFVSNCITKSSQYMRTFIRSCK